MTYKKYRRTQIAEMADWQPGFDMQDVSVSAADKAAGSPKLGDKIARNPANHDDKWLVAKAYFDANFEESPSTPVAAQGQEVQDWNTAANEIEKLIDKTYSDIEGAAAKNAFMYAATYLRQRAGVAASESTESPAQEIAEEHREQ